mgnify:CR=1 FL=1
MVVGPDPRALLPASMFIGGLRRDKQTFNRAAANAQSAMLLLALVAAKRPLAGQLISALSLLLLALFAMKFAHGTWAFCVQLPENPSEPSIPYWLITDATSRNTGASP